MRVLIIIPSSLDACQLYYVLSAASEAEDFAHSNSYLEIFSVTSVLFILYLLKKTYLVSKFKLSRYKLLIKIQSSLLNGMFTNTLVMCEHGSIPEKNAKQSNREDRW